MTVYNQHTFTSVSIGATGHVHSRAETDPDDESPTAIECSACEPILAKDGWVFDPGLVPLTDRQEREREQVEREGNLAVKQVAEALANATTQALVDASPSVRKARRAAAKAQAAG